MIRIFLCLACLSLTVPLYSAHADSLGMVKALTLLKSGKKNEAHQLLEKTFNSSDSRSERARIALMLALAKDYSLKRPRFEYAEFALRNYRNLDPAMARRLTRILGDGKYQNGDYEGARKAYQFILSSPRSGRDEQEYATYKLGWIYLKQSGPKRAFRLWQNWLEHDKSGQLREAILYDAGRAWALSLAKEQRHSLRLDLTAKSHREAFFAGILAGVDEAQGDETLRTVLLLLADQSFYSQFLNFLLDNRKVFLTGAPCDSLQWLMPADPNTVLAGNATLILTSCHEQLGRISDVNKRTQIEILLARTFGKYKVSDEARLVKADSLKRVGKIEEACLEYVDGVVDLIRKGKRYDDIPRLVRVTRQTCADSRHSAGSRHGKALRELTEVLIASQNLVGFWKDKQQAAALAKEIVQLAAAEHQADTAIRQLVQQKDTWQGTSLPELMLSRLQAGNPLAELIRRNFTLGHKQKRHEQMQGGD